MRDTDRDWQRIGEIEPYWGVNTRNRYKSEVMDEEKKAEFYRSGEGDVQKFMSTFTRYFGDDFRPSSALDFGCGVGRLVIPMARKIDKVTGIDISPGMLRNASDTALKQKLSNVQFLEKVPDKKFEWINSFIVFQHIPPIRGVDLIKDLLTKLDNLGFISIHVTVYCEANHSAADPNEIDVDNGGYEIRMYNYDINQLVELFYNAGIIDLNMEMVNHGGHIGIIFYGRKNVYHESREIYHDLDRVPIREIAGAIKRKVFRRLKLKQEST